MKERIDPSGTLVTDGWKSYPSIAEEIQVQHKIVNHSMEFKNKEGFHTNHVEGKKFFDYYFALSSTSRHIYQKLIIQIKPSTRF